VVTLAEKLATKVGETTTPTVEVIDAPAASPTVSTAVYLPAAE
jgi:hypothetical protein